MGEAMSMVDMAMSMVDMAMSMVGVDTHARIALRRA
jgi:hypothetical protein